MQPPLFLLVVLLLGWLVLAFVTASLAERKGDSAGLWFVLGVMLGPWALLGVAIKAAPAVQSHLDELKVCPHCAERVQRAAVVCRFCGRDLDGRGFAIAPEGEPALRPIDRSLIAAAAQGDRALCERMLVEGAKPEARDANGFSALDHARARGHEAVLQLLRGWAGASH